LALLKEHHLFIGTWDEHEDKRRTRVTSILDFIAQTFDASKIAKGSVNIGKYDEWAKKTFPRGLMGRRKRYLNEEGKVIEGRHRSCVGPKFISVFMSIAEFGLLTDKNQDDSLPHKRAEMVWNALYAKGLISVKFCARKWAVCREEMVKSEIIVITDRNYGPQKAMKWDEGRYFPGLGLWKCKRQPSLLEPGCYSTRTRREEREQEHNTLLYKQPTDFRDFGSGQFSRPPPVEKQAASSNITHQNDIPEARTWKIRSHCLARPQHRLQRFRVGQAVI
jgi:hypothetical protein